MEDRSISFGGGQVGSILNQRFKTPYHNSYKNCDHNNHINSLKQGCFLDNWRHFLCDSVFYVTLQFQKIKTHDFCYLYISKFKSSILPIIYYCII
jgi:hypothetical protein